MLQLFPSTSFIIKHNCPIAEYPTTGCRSSLLVDTQTGRIVAAKALIRWNHPDWVMVSPHEFIPIAIKTGLVIPMGESVVRTACQHIVYVNEKNSSRVYFNRVLLPISFDFWLEINTNYDYSIYKILIGKGILIVTKLPNSIKKILCYVRRSRQDIERERKTGEDTLAQQRNIMERILKDYELPFEMFEEIGSGDKIDMRPVFKEVLALLERDGFQAIAVREVSRMGRGSYTDMGRIYDLIKEKNILIITPYKIYDPSNHSDLRQIRFEMFLSREEFETIRERLLSGKVATALQGKWSSGGTAPYGYRVNNETQKLEPFEDEAKIVRLMFELYINGLEGKSMGFRAISTYLTRIGVPTPSESTVWSVTMVKKILAEKPETYVGTYMFQATKMVNGKKVKKPKEEWIKVPEAHPPIIDELTFEKAQLKYYSNYKPRTRLDFKTSELAGILICSVCNKRMMRQANHREYISKKTGEVTIHVKETLWCNTPGCTFVSYRSVEEAILEFIGKLSDLEDEDLETFIQQTQVTKNDEFSKDERISLAEDSLQQLRKRLEFVYDRFEEGIYSKEEFSKRREDIAGKINELTKNIEILYKIDSPEANEILVDIEKMKRTLKSVSKTYHSLENTEEKNRLLSSIIEYGILELTEKVPGNKPSKFNLDIFFKMEEFLTL